MNSIALNCMFANKAEGVWLSLGIINQIWICYHCRLSLKYTQIVNSHTHWMASTLLDLGRTGRNTFWAKPIQRASHTSGRWTWPLWHSSLDPYALELLHFHCFQHHSLAMSNIVSHHAMSQFHVRPVIDHSLAMFNIIAIPNISPFSNFHSPPSPIKPPWHCQPPRVPLGPWGTPHARAVLTQGLDTLQHSRLQRRWDLRLLKMLGNDAHMQKYLYIYVYIYMCVCVYMCIYIYIDLFIYLFIIYIYMCVCIYIYMYIYIDACVCFKRRNRYKVLHFYIYIDLRIDLFTVI